jgi:PilZ domain
MNCGFEQRKHERYRFCSPLELAWADSSGVRCSVAGTGIGASSYGMLVEIPIAVPLGTDITIRVEAVEISSTATVRHCREVGSWFRVGLKFHNTLLSEHVASLDAVLIKSLRGDSPTKPMPSLESKWWSRMFRRMEKAGCSRGTGLG